MKKYAAVVILLIAAIASYAQNKTLTLQEAIQLGLENSKQLKLSQHKIDEAISGADQSRDASLPSANVSAGYSHALMLARNLTLPSSGNSPEKLELPFDNPLYLATISVNQPIFAGNKYRYARQSADMLVQISRLNAETDKDEITFNIISAYINYYKLRQHQNVVAQNLEDIREKLEEIKKFESQGLATKNDVLRFALQESDIKLNAMELENNRRIVNYNLNIMLGLPDSTVIKEQDVLYKLDFNDNFDYYLSTALRDRNEFSTLQYQDKLADLNVKKVKDERLPSVGVGGNLYYINPTKNAIPKSSGYMAPLIVGVNVGWDIASLYKNKNKVTQAKIEKQEVEDSRDIITDHIKTEVHQRFLEYRQTLKKITVLQDAITQAVENERITESKFRNNLATTTERIDAQTLLYQTRVNLELAKADATTAYYALLQATGHIQP
ncbi:MAG TPA: TolC family protein [Agriterribacter sp.]|nr:TolC family protein [Agriterribacter sp.]